MKNKAKVKVKRFWLNASLELAEKVVDKQKENRDICIKQPGR